MIICMKLIQQLSLALDKDQKQGETGSLGQSEVQSLVSPNNFIPTNLSFFVQEKQMRYSM